MKKAVVIFAAAMLAASVFSGCGNSNAGSSSSSSSSSAVNRVASNASRSSSTASSSSSSEAEPIFYDKYGISFEVPTSWTGFFDFVEAEEEKDGNEVVTVVFSYFNGEKRSPVMTIRKMPKSYYEDAKNVGTIAAEFGSTQESSKSGKDDDSESDAIVYCILYGKDSGFEDGSEDDLNYVAIYREAKELDIQYAEPLPPAAESSESSSQSSAKSKS